MEQPATMTSARLKLRPKQRPLFQAFVIPSQYENRCLSPAVKPDARPGFDSCRHRFHMLLPLVLGIRRVSARLGSVCKHCRQTHATPVKSKKRSSRYIRKRLEVQTLEFLTLSRDFVSGAVPKSCCAGGTKSVSKGPSDFAKWRQSGRGGERRLQTHQLVFPSLTRLLRLL